jgi:hypothetical protein
MQQLNARIEELEAALAVVLERELAEHTANVQLAALLRDREGELAAKTILIGRIRELLEGK